MSVATPRRTRPRAAAGGAALLRLVVAVAAVAVSSAGVGRKKNVLLIVADSLGPVIEPYGHGEAAATPSLAGFAVNATVFTRAYAQSPSKEASRISMLTGRYPSTTGIHAPGTQFRQQLQTYLGPEVILTMPGWFRDTQGYTTRVVGEVFPTGDGMSSTLPGCTSASKPLDGCQDDGSSWSEESEVPTDRASAQCVSCLDNEAPAPGYRAWAATACAASCMEDSWTASRAATLIDSLQSDREVAEAALISRPWFLAVGLRLPAFPIVAPQADFDVLNMQGLPLSEGAPLGPPPSPGWPQETSPYARSGNRNIRAFEDVIGASSNGSSLEGLVLGSTSDHLRKAYHAALHFVDAKIGTMLDTLAARGSEAVEDTVVVVMGDRGASRGNNGAWDGDVVFDSALRTVMMIRNGSGWTPARSAAPRPGNNSGINGAQSDAMAGLVDVWPTLAELAIPNATLPGGLEGVSLAAAIAAPLLDDAGGGGSQSRGAGDVFTPRPNLPKLAQPPGHRQAAFALFPRDPVCSADPDSAGCLRSGNPATWSPPSGPRMSVTVRCATGWLFTEWTSYDFTARRPIWTQLGEGSNTLDMYDMRQDTGASPGFFGGESLALFPAMLGVRQRLRILLREGFDGPHVFEVGYIPSDPDSVLPTATAAPTPSTTASADPTPTPTTSPTPSASGSSSPTATASPTGSSTSSPSATSTRTPSATPSITGTPSANVTTTPSLSPGASPSPSTSSSGSPSVSASPSSTASSSPSPTRSASATPSTSATASPGTSATSSATASVSPSASASHSSSPTPTASVTATASASGTPSTAASTSATVTATPTLSTFPTASSAPSPSATDALPSGIPSAQPSATVTATATATTSVSPSPNASTGDIGTGDGIIRPPAADAPPGPDSSTVALAVVGTLAAVAVLAAAVLVARRAGLLGGGRSAKSAVGGGGSTSASRSRMQGDGARHSRISRLGGRRDGFASSPLQASSQPPLEVTGLIASPMAPEGVDGGGQPLDIGIRLPSRAAGASLSGWSGSRAIATRTNPVGRSKRRGRKRSGSGGDRLGNGSSRRGGGGGASPGRSPWVGGRVV